MQILRIVINFISLCVKISTVRLEIKPIIDVSQIQLFSNVLNNQIYSNLLKILKNKNFLLQ